MALRVIRLPKPSCCIVFITHKNLLYAGTEEVLADHSVDIGLVVRTCNMGPCLRLWHSEGPQQKSSDSQQPPGLYTTRVPVARRLCRRPAQRGPLRCSSRGV